MTQLLQNIVIVCIIVFGACTLFADLATGCAAQTGVLIVYTTPAPIIASGVGGNCFGGVGPPHTSCLNNDATRFSSFGSLDPTTIVNLHNVARAAVSPKAKDMGLVQWNYLMAYLAQRWAAQCANYSERVGYRSVPGLWDYVGQNTYVDLGSSTVNFNVPFNQWLNEKAQFSYGLTSLTYNQVGHYTQIIWAKTQAIGCAAAVCKTPSAVVYVCDYAPSGNLATNGRHPFAYPYTASDLTTVSG